MAQQQPIVTFYNGQTAPALAFGTWQIPKDIAQEAVYTAIKHGYRHLDFAQVYGNNVECGKGVQQAIDEGIIKSRSELWITSKIWNDAHLEVPAAVDRLLSELNIEYLDLILIHWPISFVKGANPMDYHKDLDLATVYNNLEDYALKSGKTKNLGVSNFSIEELQNILDKCTTKPIVNQVESSIYWQQRELEAFMNQHGIVLTAYSPLCQNTPPPALKIEFKNMLQDPVLVEMAKTKNTTPIAIAVRWHIDAAMVDAAQQKTQRIVIVKSNTPARIVENFENVVGSNAVTLSAEDLENIQKNITTSFRSLNPMGWRGAGIPFFPNY